MRRNQLVWGAILLLLGVLMLADQMGLRFPNGVSPTDLFWPAALLLAGSWILLGVSRRRNTEMEKAGIELNGARQASLHVSHGAGELTLHGGASASDLMRGTFAGGLNLKADRVGDRLEVRMKPATDAFVFPFFGPADRLDWDMSLNSDTPISLTLKTGANKSNISLEHLRITDLKLDTGASDTRLTLPSQGRCHADLDLGAASLDVVVPAGVSARIRASVGVADLKIDESRFPRSGGFYQSPDYESAANAAEISIDAGAASIRVR